MDQPTPLAGGPIQIRTGVMARGVFGMVFCMMTILAVGLYAEGQVAFGVVTFVFASAMLVNVWFQSIELTNGELLYFRPFFQTARIPLQQINLVRLVFAKG